MKYNLTDYIPYDAFEEDPLVNFKCMNDFCDNIFTPILILDEEHNVAYFMCPLCKTQYYIIIEFEEILENVKSLAVLDGPYILRKGSRISTA